MSGPFDEMAIERTSVLDWARSRMSSKMVKELASCDFGDDVKEHTRAIAKIIETGRVPADLQWEPAEVCDLWSWHPERMERHEERVINIFACSVLLLAGSYPECTDFRVAEGTNQKVASLLRSVFHVPEPPLGDLTRFCDWLWNHHPDGEPEAFAVLALLLVEVEREADAARLGMLARAAEEADASARLDPYLFVNDGEWKGRLVLGLSGYDLHHRLWEALSRRAMDHHRRRLESAPAARDVLERVVSG